MDYRKLYEEIHGIIPIDDHGRSFEIHHIDGNHNNNSIVNLIAVSIEEHYNIHYKQGDYNACSLICKRMNLTEKEKINLRKLSSEWMKNNNPSSKARGIEHWSTGTVVVKHNAEIFRVSLDDPKYLNGEYVSVNKGMVTVRDITGKCFSVSVDDVRYLNGELVQATKGLKRTWSSEQVNENYATRRGRKWSDDEREQRNLTRKPAWNKGLTGTHVTQNDTKNKISLKLKGVPKQKVTCPHCNKTGGISSMKQWHFNKCKENIDE